MTKQTTPAGSAAAVPQAERLSKLALMLENGYPPKAAASQLRDMAAASQQVEAAPKEFERWLRRACFQKPTPEAYDLAKCAWQEASRPPAGADTQAVADVLAERERQKIIKGYDSTLDDAYTGRELAYAAAAYCLAAAGFTSEGNRHWPWEKHSFKPSSDARRSLVKGVALALAEIERLDRAARQEGKGGAS